MKVFFLIVFILFFIVIIYGVYQNSQPKALGLIDGRLAKCHKKPNCISSTNKHDKKHYFAAIKLDRIKFEKLKLLLNNSSNIKLKTQSNNYIHAVATTKIGFKDDIEFYFDEKTLTLSFRSVSRVGKSDFGVNKKRIINIINHLNE